VARFLEFPYRRFAEAIGIAIPLISEASAGRAVLPSTEEFLDFLLKLRLGDWHPREILRTSEAIEQQRMSADSVTQWAQACVDADKIVGAGRGPYGSEITHVLETSIASRALREAYTGFCKQNALRPLSVDGFGKACAEMFGPRKRLTAKPLFGDTQRPWGYDVPDGEAWQKRIDARLGIPS